MNTPISLEIAKLLKEKGFDLNHKYMFFTSDETEKYPEGELSLKPTIVEVVMWLYEKHGIWVNVSIENNEDDKVSFYFSLLQNDDNEVVFKLRQSNYNSPKEAYEAAIIYTLKNLI